MKHVLGKGKLIDTVLNIAIGILTVTALVLGLLIYQEMGGSISLPQISLPTAKTSASPTPTGGAGAETASVNDPSLTGERGSLLVVPGEKADEKTKAEYIAKVNAAAKEVNTVSVTKCQTDPVVVKAKKGSKLTYKNNDAAEITVKWPGEKSLVIPANQSKAITLDFVAEEGLITYTCGDNILAGMLLLSR